MIPCPEQSILLKNFHLMLFLRHTTKRKVQAQPWLSFWRYRQTPISIQTRKAHTLWHEHSLTYIWWIYSSKLAIFQNSSSKKQTHFFFQYVLLNFYFISHSFVYVVAKILFFLRQITDRQAFYRNYIHIRKLAVWAGFPCLEEEKLSLQSLCKNIF